MKNILWLSPYVPYDQVPHAGGKAHNYYVKYFHKSGLFHIHLITLAQKQEESYFDLEQYGISHQVKIVNGGPFKNVCRILYNVNSVYNKRHRLCQTILSYQYHQLKKMADEYAAHTIPDIVIMQWTGTAFLLPYLKELFPRTFLVIIEEDVTFLGYERRYLSESNERKRKRLKDRYERLKIAETELINQCNLVIVNNAKDKNLLLQTGIPAGKIYEIAPYYKDYSFVVRKHCDHSIVFFGVMDRKENHDCAVWLIRQVMPLLDERDIHLEIVGIHPRSELLKMANDKIHIRGYVENVGEFFSRCLCVAAPLQLGAGIKIKILEAMSAGVPVLTNSIGIEGIPARDGKEYCLCEKPEEYAETICRLCDSVTEREKIGNTARDFMKKSYQVDQQLNKLIRLLSENRK